MRKLTGSLILAAALVVILAGCSDVADKPVVKLTDNTGVVEQHVVTVGYVNDRLDRMSPLLLPDTPGEEGKRQFIEEIVKKELLVIEGHRLAYSEDPLLEMATPYFIDKRINEMFREDAINKPSQPTDEEVESFYHLRETTFLLQEITVPDEEAAADAYRRVTEGGEDFGVVAAEVSAAKTAADQGRRPVIAWMDLHPLTRLELQFSQKGDVTPPFAIGETHFLYRVLSRKEGPQPKAFEGAFKTAVAAETRSFKRSIVENRLNEQLMSESDLTFNDEGIAVAGTRIDEMVAEVIPPPDESMSFEERMELARISVVPDFTEEEAEMLLATYRIGETEHVMTLGTLRDEMAALPGIETIKGGEPGRIKSYIRRQVRDGVIEYEIDLAGYADLPEIDDYVAERHEEMIVDLVYENEVNMKISQPTGQEIRDYFRSHREDFKKPAAVDVQQLIVGTEAEANHIVQRLGAGEATFDELVDKHSIDEWSKAKNGMIVGYEQGERRLDYLQGVAFDLEIGKISEPFRAPGGYAVIRVTASYPEELLTFSDVADVVKISVWNIAKEARLLELLDNIRESVTIEIIDSNLQYVKDPAEVLKQKESEKVSVTKTFG